MSIFSFVPTQWAPGACIRRAGLAALLPLLALGCTKTSSSTSSAPTVTSFSPTTNTLGTGTQIIVYGSGFSTATGVTICGVTVPSASSNADNQVLSDTEMEFDLPAVTTTGPIVVTGPGGTGSSSQDFIVVPSLSTFPVVAPGAESSLTGNGLLGVTAVTFTNTSTNATTSATIDSATATTLTITIPGTLSGGTSYDYTLSNTYGVPYVSGTYTPS